ncbi:conserved oligomeric Golgi complex subunit 6 [Planococcus citri]|uniref:conserved oligomeric Golgi complex subunit 6 n=1 Tax=Planococcus citri TaxID=170843 RepID=UPI0031F7B710
MAPSEFDENSRTKEDKGALFHSERLQKILLMKLGKNNKTLEAFHELSTISNENSLNFRRTLRSKIERRGIHIIKDFLKHSEGIKKALDQVHENAVNIDEAVNESIDKLRLTKNKTFHLQDHASKFIKESERLRMEETILSSYLQQFQLSKKETEILKQADINTEFFGVLDKSQYIYNSCQILLNCGHTTSAVSIMEELSLLQETALEFLYRWTQIHCKDIESAKIAFLLTKAMKHFQNRAVSFSNLMDEYSAARRAVMVRLFIDALTKGGANGFPKPIETYVHDKKRYVGDMLAWLRQYIPTEKEYFSLFLKECNLNRQDIQNEIRKGMSNITEGVCNILVVRIEYLISSSSSPFELYDSASLLRYYSKIISDELNDDSALSSTLNELGEITECAFLNSIQNLVRHNVLEKVEAPCADLSPSPGVNYLLNFMSEILSMVGLNVDRKEFTLKVISCVVEPLLQAINLSASKLTSVDMAVYLLNCSTEILNTISFYEFVDEWLERLQAQIDAQMDTLTSEQASFLINNLNLGLMYPILQDTSKAPLSQVPGMDAASLKCFMEKLENFTHSPSSIMLPQITFIANNAQREKILKRSYEVIVAVYKQLYDCVYEPTNLYRDPKTLMPHSPQYIQEVLMSSESRYEL